MPKLAVHDFDEIGVPSTADTRWRQQANEDWLRRALDYQSKGVDTLLAGQTPLGEWLATPSALPVDGISACLLDCSDEVRLARLRARGPEWLARSRGEFDDYLGWAEWLRRHARDPQWQPDVIRSGDPENELCWGRWSDWQADDARWRVHVVDTSALPVARVAADIATWVAEERDLVRLHQHPLALWVETERSQPTS